MNPRTRALLRLLILLAVVVGLIVAFPVVLSFVELAARSLRFLWWLILLIGLGIWFIWAAGRKPKNRH